VMGKRNDTHSKSDQNDAGGKCMVFVKGTRTAPSIKKEGKGSLDNLAVRGGRRIHLLWEADEKGGVR